MVDGSVATRVAMDSRIRFMVQWSGQSLGDSDSAWEVEVRDRSDLKLGLGEVSGA